MQVKRTRRFKHYRFDGRSNPADEVDGCLSPISASFRGVKQCARGQPLVSKSDSQSFGSIGIVTPTPDEQASRHDDSVGRDHPGFS